MRQTEPVISVLMPTYKHAAFISRAIDSLLAQTYSQWELIIVDDGSPDQTAAVVERFRTDSRIHYERLAENVGLGAALNRTLDLSQGELVAYLPSDDVYYANHLQTLFERLHHSGAVLAYSGLRHHYNRITDGVVEGYPMQLVQVLHRRTPDRWLERNELVTDDLERMYWGALRQRGAFAATHLVTAEWVNHPYQRHKIMQEPVGGINLYKTYYQVKQPLRYKTLSGNLMDEVSRYERFRRRPDTPRAHDGLKILLVGELAYNAERVLALEERGHELYGLWMPDPYWYNYVGPLPFGHVRDIPYANWQAEVKRIQPDVIYALLNWQAVPFCHEILSANPGIPFVWHFKEGPFICLEKGTWNQLVDLYARSHAQIYCSPEMRDWFAGFLPPADPERTLVLDGDLPKQDWFAGERSPLLSERDGEIHTVVPGRPIGLHPHNVAELAQQKIHLHFYGDFIHGQWRAWIEKAQQMAPHYLHIHPNVDQEQWVSEFSQYDAGWLHFFESQNCGEIRRANWDDLNYPARIATLALAGLPMLQRDNSGHIVATDRLARQFELGLQAKTIVELGEQLGDRQRLARVRDSVWRQRHQFVFDHHADTLIAFFRQVVGTAA